MSTTVPLTRNSTKSTPVLSEAFAESVTLALTGAFSIGSMMATLGGININQVRIHLDIVHGDIVGTPARIIAQLNPSDRQRYPVSLSCSMRRYEHRPTRLHIDWQDH